MKTLEAQLHAVQIKKIVIDACSLWSNEKDPSLAKLEQIVEDATDQIIKLESE